MKGKDLNGSLGIVAVGVVLMVLGFVYEPLRFLLIFALLIGVIGAGVAFFGSLQSE